MADHDLAMLLSEGLDLCVRARKMDETISNFVKADDGIYESPLRCGTVSAMTLADLIAALEAATGPNRELDLGIHALAFPEDYRFRKSQAEQHDDIQSCPNFTSSIDAALTLVPEGWFVQKIGDHVSMITYKGDRHDHINWFAEVQHRDGGRLKHNNAETLPIALCIAALRARAQAGE